MTDRRPKEPEFLRVWRDLRRVADVVPKCCHTCENYSQTGVCDVHAMRPPEKFASYESENCPDYMNELPF